MTLPAESGPCQTNKLDKTVYIKADTRAKYGRFEEVIDDVRAGRCRRDRVMTELIPGHERPPKKPGAMSGQCNN